MSSSDPCTPKTTEARAPIFEFDDICNTNYQGDSSSSAPYDTALCDTLRRRGYATIRIRHHPSNGSMNNNNNQDDGSNSNDATAVTAAELDALCHWQGVFHETFDLLTGKGSVAVAGTSNTPNTTT